MTLEQLRLLVKVVEAGSFTRAAELLGTQKSHASRVVAQLEAELGAQLLERNTRSLSVTEIGREVLARARAIVDAVDDTRRLVEQAQARPRGLLRLTCGVEFGRLAVGRWVDDYLQAQPDVQVEVEYTSRVLDLVHEGLDLAIRVGTPPPSRLVARPLGQIEYALFACPRYLQHAGVPRTPADLRAHSLVMFSGGGQRRGWTLHEALSPADGPMAPHGEPVRIDGPARLRVNNSDAVRDALLHALGIGALPLLIAREAVAAARLVPVLPQWRPPPSPVHAVYPSSRYLSPKVRAFIDLALARFPGEAAQARAALACGPAGA